MRKHLTVWPIFVFPFFLFVLMQTGCGSTSVDSPLLRETVSIDETSSARFPKEPQKMENDLTSSGGSTVRSLGLYLRDEEYTFEAMAMDNPSGIKPDIERLAERMFDRDKPVSSIMRQETLSDGKEIYYLLGSGTRHAKSARFIVVPGGKLYMTGFSVNTEGTPDQDALHIEQAFHQSFRLNGKRVDDSLDMTDLIAGREKSITEAIAARDEVVRKTEERARQQEIEREEQAQRSAELNRETMGRVQDRMAGTMVRGRGPMGRRPQAERPTARQSDADRQPEDSYDGDWRPDPPSGEGAHSSSGTDSPQNTASSSPNSEGTMPGGQRLGRSLNGMSFLEEVPPRHILVGFQVTLKKGWGSDCVESIRPLYTTQDGSEPAQGGIMGKATGNSVKLLAPKGYAVGGLDGRAVAIVDGFSLVYMKIKPDGTLDPNDTKKSDWVGNEKPGSRSSINGNGKPVKEILGNSEEFVSSFELVF